MKKSRSKVQLIIVFFIFILWVKLSLGNFTNEFDQVILNKYDKRNFDVEISDLLNEKELELNSDFFEELSLPAMSGTGEILNVEKFDNAFDGASEVTSLNEDNLVQLPVGITKNFGGASEAQLVIVNAYFLTDYIMLDVLAKVTWNGKSANGENVSRTLRFGAWNVKYYYKYGFQGEAKLILLQNVEIPIDKNGSNLMLAGEFNQKSGQPNYSKSCYLSFGCNGIESLEGHFIGTLSIQGKKGSGIEGENSCLIKPAMRKDDDFTASDGLLTIDFETTCSLNNFYFSTSLGLFTIGDTDIFFDVKDITVDLSTVKSHERITDNLWEGFYVDQFTVYMPKSFRKKENGKNERVSATISNLKIDESGISGAFLAENLTTLENGVAGGWPFSVNSLSFAFDESNLNSIAFSGDFRPPVLSDTSQIHYSGRFEKNKYSIDVDLINSDETFRLDVFLADLKIGGGGITITKRENQNDLFVLRLENGSFALKGDKLSGFAVNFQEFVISNEPSLTIITPSPREQDKPNLLANFPITVSTFDFNKDQLRLGLNINLMKEQINGGVDATIYCKYEEVDGRQKWKYDGIKVGEIAVEGNFTKFSLKGKVSMYDSPEKKGFSGDLNVGLQLVKDSIGIKATAEFGTKFSETEDYRYWHVDMFANGFRVPLFTGVDLTGIGGGAANRMFNMGDGGFEPDSSMGMFFRVNTELTLAASSSSKPSQVALEMQFNKKAELMYIQLFGEVNMTPSINDVPGASALMKGYNDLASKSGGIQQKLKNAGFDPANLQLETSDFTSRFPASLSTANTQVKIQLILNMDFQENIFTGNASTFFNAGGFLVGNQSQKVGNTENGYAGSVYMVFRKDEWFVHAGYKHYDLDDRNLPNALHGPILKKFDPLGIALRAKDKDLATISAYLLLGQHIPELPYPNRDLGITSFPDNVLDKYGSVKRGSDDTNLEGAGLAFGAAAEFQIPPIEFLILYANLHAYLGFDVLLKHYETCICDNWEGPSFGMNNWYAQGQAYAGLDADIGVYVKLFGKTKQIPAIKANMDILLQAKLPHPTWFSGTLSGSYSVLGGAVHGEFDMNCTFGDECGNIDQQKSEDIPEIQIVNKIEPAEGATMSPVDMPVVFYNYEFNTPFNIDPDIQSDFQYMLVVDDVTGGYVGDPTELKFKLWWSNTKKMYIDFEDENEIWRENSDVELAVHYSMMEKVDGNWVVATEKVGDITEEIRGDTVINFKTGGTPTTLGLNGVVDMYPAVDQDYFYTGGSKNAYIQIQSNLKSIFVNSKGKTKDIDLIISNEKGSQTIKPTFNNLKLAYTLPVLEKDKTYLVDLKVGKNKVFSFEFHTSKFNSFEDKVAHMGSVISRPGSQSIQIPFSYAYDEPFGREEIVGNSFMNGGKPLVTAKIDLSQSGTVKFIPALLNYIYSSNRFIDFTPEKAQTVESTNVYSSNWGVMEYEMESESMFPFVFTTFDLIKADFDEVAEYLPSICSSGYEQYPGLEPIVDEYKSETGNCQFNLPLNEYQYTFPLSLSYNIANAGVSMSNVIDITYNN